MHVGTCSYAHKMVQSVKSVLNVPVVQMTDLKSVPVEGVDEVRRLPFKVGLMMFRMKHLIEYPHDEMAILDTDIIAKKAIDEVWAQPFDVALTRRAGGRLLDANGHDLGPFMPFNSGVMFSRTTEFWRDCYSIMQLMPPDLQNWYGDQFAIAEIAKRGKYKVLELQCMDYNWTPKTPEDSSSASFWHYKGDKRKDWM